MDTQNVTLAIPKNILYKAKLMAVKKRTSLSHLLAETIEEMVSEEEQYETAKQRYFALLEKRTNLGTNGEITWTREELYARNK